MHAYQAFQVKWLLLVMLLVSVYDDTKTVYHCIIISVSTLCVFQEN